MIHTISIVALWMSGISFALFVIALILQLFGPKPTKKERAKPNKRGFHRGSD